MCFRNIKESVYIDLWCIIAETSTKYIRNTEINGEDNFKVMISVLAFPVYLDEMTQVGIILNCFLLVLYFYLLKTAFYILIDSNESINNSVEIYVQRSRIAFGFGNYNETK